MINAIKVVFSFFCFFVVFCSFFVFDAAKVRGFSFTPSKNTQNRAIGCSTTPILGKNDSFDWQNKRSKLENGHKKSPLP